ncbi:MAG: VOC family protein [bacterium]|nr:VOC family protein [bacterium]
MPHRDGYTQGEPCWVDLSAEDIAGAQAFYGGLFGWTWEEVPTRQGFTYSMAQKDGHTVAGLGPAPQEILDMGLRSVWNTYLAADSVDEVYKRAIECGGTGLMEPEEVMNAGRMAYILDNQGAAFGIWQAGDHRGAQLIKEPGSLSWSELYVPDVGSATQFLATVFGLDSEPTDMGPMSYTLLKAAGEIVAGVMTPPENVPPSWCTYFATADVKETASKVEELGGAVMNGPFTTPLGDMIVAADFAGGVFLVNQVC